MTLIPQSFLPIQNEKNQPNFIHLKNKTFAEYNFIYHINDGYIVKELMKFNDRNQLLFQKISNKVMQMNLMIVDSVFPLLLSDVVLFVLLNKSESFHNYINANKRIFISNKEYNIDLLKYKFRQFIHYLLYSDIASEIVFTGSIDSYKVYYLKDVKGELKYYSIYEQNELQELMFNRMKLEINFKKSIIRKDEAEICLRISI